MADESTGLLSGSTPKRSKETKTVIFVLAALVILGGILTILFTVGPLKPDDRIGIRSPLADALSSDAMIAHLKEFEAIASRHNNSRSVSRGHAESAEYVRSTLESKTSLIVSVQYFNVSLYESNSLPVLNLSSFSSSPANGGEANWIVGRDYNTLGNMGSGDLKNASITLVLGDSFENFPAGSIAMFTRNSTTAYRAKINAALDAGAAGVLLYQPGSSGGTAGATCVGPRCSEFPGLGLSLSAATDILSRISAGIEVRVDLFTDIINYNFTTLNVIAETKGGNEDKVLVVGSHLDSVPAGPGINDDGSGSAWLLETAINFDKLNIKPAQKVRFAWWSAEEIGLLGSYAYVKQLEESGGLGKVAVNLNYDMIASPNGFRGVYDGKNAADANIRTASGVIQDLHVEYFDSNNQEHDTTPFTGRSDYGPFIEKGIPAGGLFSGAEELKTLDQRKRYGGLANIAYDPCYHQSCDDVYNLSVDLYDSMGRCAAYVVERIALEKDLDAFLKGSEKN